MKFGFVKSEKYSRDSIDIDIQKRLCTEANIGMSTLQNYVLIENVIYTRRTSKNRGPTTATRTGRQAGR